jgi:hypothetical protein
LNNTSRKLKMRAEGVSPTGAHLYIFNFFSTSLKMTAGVFGTPSWGPQPAPMNGSSTEQ